MVIEFNISNLSYSLVPLNNASVMQEVLHNNAPKTHGVSLKNALTVVVTKQCTNCAQNSTKHCTSHVVSQGLHKTMH